MIRLKFHPAFWLFAIATVLEGKYAYLLATMGVVIIHELAHARAAYNLGYVMNEITVMPYGAMLSAKEPLARKDYLPIALAGPIANLIICGALYALWWAIPAAYSYTKVIFDASLAIALFNLLPAYPLDGARVIIALSKHPLKTLAALRITGKIISIMLFALYLASYFGSLNYSLGAVSVMLYISADGGTENEVYRHLYEVIPYSKQLNSPIECKTVAVHEGLKLVRLMRHINSTSITTFEVIDNDLKRIAILDESALEKLLIDYPAHTTLKEALSSSHAKNRALRSAHIPPPQEE